MNLDYSIFFMNGFSIFAVEWSGFRSLSLESWKFVVIRKPVMFWQNLNQWYTCVLLLCLMIVITLVCGLALNHRNRKYSCNKVLNFCFVFHFVWLICCAIRLYCVSISWLWFLEVRPNWAVFFIHFVKICCGRQILIIYVVFWVHHNSRFVLNS